jgi:predicted CXXCH cytochrome family protein
MKRYPWFQWVNTVVALAALASGAGVALAGIADTPHNLGSTGVGSNRVTDSAEICVFCHTPHGSDTSAPVPLWNKTLPAGGSFLTYDTLGTSSLFGEVLPVGSVSLACLSCHDGTQAMDNLMNAPGSGGFSATGGGAIGAGFSWGASPGADPEGRMAATTVSMLGTDLRNDHPIGIEYCGGGITGSGMTVSGTCNDRDFIGPGGTDAGRLQTRNVDGKQVFWVDTVDGIPGTREKSDMALFTRTFAGGIERPSVECASCHDPHAQKRSVNEVNFLRTSQDGSRLCLACHVK